MLGSAVPATATIHTSTSSATPTSPTRPSRLRGLSYLRNYTRDHLSSSSTGKNENTPTQSLQRSNSTEDSTIHNGEKGWVPTVQGRSVPSASTELATSPDLDINNSSTSSTSVGMTRGRAASAQQGPIPTPPTATTPATSSRTAAGPPPRRSSLAEGMTSSTEPPPTASTSSGNKESLAPTIRFIPHVESRSSRPSLNFTAISRTLKQPSSVVRVGRYSERDTASHATAAPHHATPVGFKSKVVSRRHCEFWCTNGQWYVKDVKSSSGTFLNHVRLSSPGVESRPFPVNDGDVVQLGIDFKGGEEVIFRCVKIRIECNRGWQKSLNSFNTSAHKRLLKSAGAQQPAAAAADSASVNSSECSICLNPVAPCQALFVAPCSHVWHFKCVRGLIQEKGSSGWPNFLCPNCRFVADLEADVDAPEEWWDGDAQEMVDDEDGGEQEEQELEAEREVERSQRIEDEELAGLMENTALQPRQQQVSTEVDETHVLDLEGTHNTTSQPVDIDNSRRTAAAAEAAGEAELLSPRSTTPTSNAQFALAAGVMNMETPSRRLRSSERRDGSRSSRGNAGTRSGSGSAERRNRDT